MNNWKRCCLDREYRIITMASENRYFSSSTAVKQSNLTKTTNEHAILFLLLPFLISESASSVRSQNAWMIRGVSAFILNNSFTVILLILSAGAAAVGY